MKLKAFLTWLISSCLLSGAIGLGEGFYREHRVDTDSLPSLLTWELREALPFSLIAAGLGVMILWLLPIRRALVGIVSGIQVAIAMMTIWVLWILQGMHFNPGFEEGPGIVVMVYLLLPPWSLAGAYAGYLRSRDHHQSD